MFIADSNFVFGVGVGFVLGVAVGIALAVWRTRRAGESDQFREFVLGVLERRAHAMGIPPAERGQRSDPDPIASALKSAKAIHSAEEKLVLPFSDTARMPKFRD